MQKTKVIKLTERELTISELKVRDIYDLIGQAGQNEGAFFGEMSELLHRCSGLTMDDLMGLYPSEVEDVWAAIQEVNASFLSLARKLGVDRLIRQILDGIRIDLAGASAASSPEATPESGTMGSLSS